MKNKLAMFTGAYMLATITAGVYAYQRISKLKWQRDNEIDQLGKDIADLEYKLKKGYEEHDKLDKLTDQLKQVISNQNIRNMELFAKLSEKDSELLELKSKVGRLLENNENLERDLGDAQLALQSNDTELKSLRARLADYECPDELAIKL